MITPWQIYLVTRCNAIHWLLIVCIVCCVVALLVLFVSCITNYGDFDEEQWKSSSKYMKTSVVLFFALLIVNALIPTNEEAIAMLSIPAIANSELVQKDIPQAIRQLWEKYAETEEKRNEKK